MSYYDNAQWSAGSQGGWDHQTPPARSGASSAIPREEPSAFSSQFEEVDKALDNLVKSGKMFGGGPVAGPGAGASGRHGRIGSNAGPRPHSASEFGDRHGHHNNNNNNSNNGNNNNLQSFYATQRHHQSSRGSNDAEQMMQAKRRMAAQRERELRNYHQEQQYNRTVMATDITYGNKVADRALSPGTMSEDERRDLIARQRSALYGEGTFAETGGYVDETGITRPGLPHSGPSTIRNHSPLAYEYGRTPPALPDGGPKPPSDGPQTAGANERSRANSNSSPQSNPPTNKGVFEAGPQQSSRTSASSPGGSPPRSGPIGAPGSKPSGSAVAPIGTRPSGTSGAPSNPALNKRSTTPLPSPLSQGYNAPGKEDGSKPSAAGAPGNANAASENAGPGVGLAGWGSRTGVWGNQSSGRQASVWG